MIDSDERALHTDLYQLTMAAGYFDAVADAKASFELFVRRLPRDRGYLLAAGLAPALEYLENLRFTGDQVGFLKGHDAFRHVGPAFFEYLRELRFEGEVWALPEGTAFFAGEPVLRVTAPIIQAQIVETYLLSLINFQCLVATKASRVVQSAAGRPVADFGTRRAHGPEAGVLAARACYVGGCAATSNVHAGHTMGIPVTGTMAHSFIMAFDSEQESFHRYLELFPESTTLLLDTYDTLEAARLAARFGDRIAGVRIDSGDLASLSREVRRILDEAGLAGVRVIASGDLNEYKIADLVDGGAAIDLFGVGTEMVTSRDEPTLSGVYKMVELEREGRPAYRIKLSSDKESWPGRKQVFRHVRDGMFVGDEIALSDEPPGSERVPLLEKVMASGLPVGQPPTLEAIRARAQDEIRSLSEGVRRLRDPEPYPIRPSNALVGAAEEARTALRNRAESSQ